MTSKQFKELVLSFDGTIEIPHFDRRAFKVLNKRIFASLHEEKETANLKFSLEDQGVYTSIDKKAIYPIDNKWGLQGWTTFDLKKVDKQLMLDALNSAYQQLFKTEKKKLK